MAEIPPQLLTEPQSPAGDRKPPRWPEADDDALRGRTPPTWCPSEPRGREQAPRRRVCRTLCASWPGRPPSVGKPCGPSEPRARLCRRGTESGLASTPSLVGSVATAGAGEQAATEDGLRGRASDLALGRPGAIPVTGGDSVPGSSPATGHVPTTSPIPRPLGGRHVGPRTWTGLGGRRPRPS